MSTGKWQCQSTLTVDSWVKRVAFSPDGSVIAAAYSDEIQLFDAQTQAKLGSPLRGHSEDNPDCTCQHYDEDEDEDYEQDPDCPVTGHSKPVLSVAFSADGQWVMFGSSDETIRLWDTHAAAQ